MLFRSFYKSLQDSFKKSGEGIMGAILCAFVNQSYLLEYEKSGLKVMSVNYESLVSYPKAIISDVLSFLGKPWDDRVLDHPSLHKGIYTGQNNSKRYIDKASLNKWERVLSPFQIEKIDNLIKELRVKSHCPFGMS